MHFRTATVAAAGLAAHQVLAFGGYGGGDWGSSSHYSTPDNTDNQCSSAQASGYNWSGLPTGSFSKYGSNNFHGWSCTNSFGKRDLLTKRSFQSKCISSNLDDEPSIGCDADTTMSIDKYEISSNKDADVECHYSMPDGSTCKETHACSAGGSVIQNSQCGGAKSVTFKPAEGSKNSGCSIGVHSVGFNCGSASSSPPTYPSTTAPSYSTSTPTSSAETTSSPTAPAYGSSSAPVVYPSSSPSSPAIYPSSSQSAPSYQSSSTPAAVSPTSSSAPAYVPSSSIEVSPTSSSPASQSVPQYGLSSSSAPSYAPSSSTEVSPTNSSPASQSVPQYGGSSSLVQTYPASAPVQSSSSALGYNSSVPASTGTIPTYGTSSTTGSPITSGSIVSYSTSTIYSTTEKTITSCAASVTDCPASSGSSVVVTETVAISTTLCPVSASDASASETGATGTAPAPTYSSQPQSPNVLPKCLSTWLYLTSCKDNSDYSCFCKDKNFMEKVYGCLSAWSSSSEDVNGAASYLMGICAPYISHNPAIITACPSSVTPAATYSYQPTTSSTEESPITSTPASYAPETITIYSTKQETITSCGPEITNCPASTHLTSYAVGTTVTTRSAPVYSNGPASTAPATVPCTTISFSSTYAIPATYSTGESQGATIPSSSITTSIITTVTVPQVQITTYTVTSAGTTQTQAGLGYGSPAPVPAETTAPPAPPSYASSAAPYPTPSAPSAPGYAAPSGFGTTYMPGPSASSSPIAPYTGSGTTMTGSGFAGVVFLACAALFLV